MRNKYPGTCYRCGKHCAAGDGHFEKFKGSWRVQHANCAIEHRGTPDPARQQHMKEQRARKQAKAQGLSGSPYMGGE